MDGDQKQFVVYLLGVSHAVLESLLDYFSGYSFRLP